MDSNHRRHKPADLQSAPFGHSGILPSLISIRADGGIRTPDQLITNQLLWPTELHRHSVISECKYMHFILNHQIPTLFFLLLRNSRRTSDSARQEKFPPDKSTTKVQLFCGLQNSTGLFLQKNHTNHTKDTLHNAICAHIGGVGVRPQNSQSGDTVSGRRHWANFSSPTVRPHLDSRLSGHRPFQSR